MSAPTYIRVSWRHSSPDEPVLFYCELDAQRYETRRIVVFSDGRIEYASSEDESRTELGDQPHPSLAEIASIGEFEPDEITKAEFESAWDKRRAVGR